MLEESFNYPIVLNYTNCPTIFYLETITTDTTPLNTSKLNLCSLSTLMYMTDLSCLLKMNK